MNYAIKPIPKTEVGVAFYLNYYKPFRLRALETDPSVFDDDKWTSRILSPTATTMVAVAEADSEATDGAASTDEKNPNSSHDNDSDSKSSKWPAILSAKTLVGPLPAPPELVSFINNNKVIDHPMANERDCESPLVTEPLVWGLHGVWTVPEARRRGIATHLLREMVRLVRSQGQAATSASSEYPKEEGTQAAAAGRRVSRFLVAGVEKNNTSALALYTKSGYVPFSEVKEGERDYTCLYLPVEHMAS
ncbi:hypothetical protein QBC37DRAFT_465050 [Rhypophila decipiens]|uniref:N-acetyltransferase domain-containing protein n=1 Tax=Rhypophila decipiens TaxID=261697 RepID=A0AAN7B7E6_9PEZI|nr:hypothetical protein QBC37DRAFT_465050 [Rhypophila decipiens]